MAALTESSPQQGSTTSGSAKVYFDGTHRTLSPAETWLRIKPHFAALGITRVAPITGLDTVGIPVVMVARPNARSLSVSQGKGVDLCCAKVSGAMESIEQHCAEHLDLPLRYISWSELRRRALAPSPAELPFSKAEVEQRPMLWLEGVREADGAPCWLPYACVHLDLRRPLAPDSDLYPLSSNGLASGNTRAEALLHAVLEVVERDAWARFVALPPEDRQRRVLDLASVTDPRALELLAKLQSGGLTVRVWDLSHELGVACFLCQVIEEAASWAFRMGRAEGLGCHTQRGVALARALCEAAQSRLCAIAGSRDDMTRKLATSVRDPLSIQRAQRELAEPSRPEVDFARVPSQDFAFVDAELRWLTAQLQSWAGAEVLSVELPTFGVPVHVVRALVTRLRPPHFLSLRAPRRGFEEASA